MRVAHAGMVIVSSLVLLAACGDTFQPRTSLQEVRVLAVETNPLEVGIGESVTVTPVVHVPDGRSVASYRWHYCPINLGAAAGYTCIDPGCDVELTTASFRDPVTLTPSTDLFACVGVLAERAEEEGSDVEGGIDPDSVLKVDTALFYELTDDEGRVFRHIKSIPLWVEKPEVINEAPVISDVFIDTVSVVNGDVAQAEREAEIEVRVTIDPESMGTYLNTQGEVVDEDAIISFYSTAGGFDADRKDGLDVTNVLKFSAGEMAKEPWEPPLALGPEVNSLDIYVVARDGQGGQTAAGPFTIDLVPASSGN